MQGGAVVLDIEGTTSSTTHVTDVLYPYARARYATWLAAHGDEPAVRAQLDVVAASGTDVVATLGRWTDEDRKETALKAIQGWIWDEGFAAGDLRSHFYPDVAPALRRWHAAGHGLWVFSSGSVTAQRAWFAHGPDGDLTALVSGWFDTETAGPKRAPASYARIAAVIGVTPIVFLSDVAAELDAARVEGWTTVGVRRPGEPRPDAALGDHTVVASFAEVDALLV